MNLTVQVPSVPSRLLISAELKKSDSWNVREVWPWTGKKTGIVASPALITLYNTLASISLWSLSDPSLLLRSLCHQFRSTSTRRPYTRLLIGPNALTNRRATDSRHHSGQKVFLSSKAMTVNSKPDILVLLLLATWWIHLASISPWFLRLPVQTGSLQSLWHLQPVLTLPVPLYRLWVPVVYCESFFQVSVHLNEWMCK